MGIIIEGEVETNGAEAPKTPAAAPKAPTPKANGRIATLEAEAKTMRQELDEVRWCFAEFMHNVKVAAAQQLLQNPEVQEKLQQMLISQMAQNGG